MSAWPDYHRATDADRAIRRQATALRGIIMLGWHEAYARQQTELRKADTQTAVGMGITDGRCVEGLTSAQRRY